MFHYVPRITFLPLWLCCVVLPVYVRTTSSRCSHVLVPSFDSLSLLIKLILMLWHSSSLGVLMASACELDVRGSVHHITILTVKTPTRCNSLSTFYYSLF